MRVGERLEKGGRAIEIEINGTDKQRDRIEHSGSVSRKSEKRGRERGHPQHRDRPMSKVD